MRKFLNILLLSFASFVTVQANEFKIDSLNHKLTHNNLSPEEKMKTYEALGAEYENSYRAMESANAYRQAVSYCRELKKEEKLTELLFNYASMSLYAGDYDNALISLEETLDLMNDKDNEQLKARVLMQLGVVNFFQQKWDNALYFYEQALESAQTLKNDEGISISYNNIANIYQKKGEYNRALEYYGKAIEMQRQMADSASICNCLMNIGTIYLEMGQLNNARQSLNEALKIAYIICDNEIKALSHMNMGMLYADEHNFDKAADELQKANTIASNSGYNQVLLEILNKTSLMYEVAGDYKQSLQFQREADVLGDSLLKQEMQQRTRELEIKYKTDEMGRNLQESSKSLRTARLLYISFFLIIILLIIAVAYIIRYSKVRKKQNKHLSDLNFTKDKLLSIISHDLKNPIYAQKVAINEMIEDTETYDEKAIDKLKVFSEAIESQLTLLQNLLNWTSLQTGKIKFNPVAFNISPAIDNVANLYKVSAHNKNIQLKIDTDSECIVYSDKQMIGTVIRNLINNAIKFSKPDNEIIIKSECYDEYVKISISDNGVGIAQDQINNILNNRKNISLEDTKGERSSGLGLIVCMDLLEINNSTLDIKSEVGKGTTTSFKLPKA